MEIPDGWTQKTINDVLSKKTDSVDVQASDEYRQIGIRSHGKGIFYKEPVSGLSLGNKRVFWIHPDCFIVNIVFGWEQAVAVTSGDEVGMVASHRFPMYRSKNNGCDVEYIEYFFKSKYGKYLLELASPGGAGRNKTLGQKSFLEIPLVLPALKEQQKIVKVLKTWDQAIAACEALIAKSEAQKKALMQQLLTGKRRLPGFDGEWQEVRLGEVANCLDRKRIPLNGAQRSEKQGVIPYYGANGVVDYIDNHIFDQDLVLLAEDGGYFDEYATRPIAQFITGKSWVNNHAHILEAKKQTTEKWLYYLLVHKNIMAFVNAGTRAKLNKSDMLSIPILMPEKDEQNKIIEILDGATSETNKLNSRLQILKTEKAALMQQLLTGKRRIKLTRVAA